MEPDFKPFADLSSKPYAPKLWGMTAHLLFSTIDDSRPASASPYIIRHIIRERIGFSGFLVSDDIDMKGLAALGDVDERAAAVLDSGNDAVLYCSGKIKDMKRLVNALPPLSHAGVERFKRSEVEGYVSQG